MKVTIIILFIVLIIFLVVYLNSIPKRVKYVGSDIDNKLYLVRDLPDAKYASNLLARLRLNLINLSDYMYNNKDKKDFEEYIRYIEELDKKIRHIDIIESNDEGMYTSYSVNKGEQIVFCLRERTFEKKLHDINVIMYVALHEIAHVACPEYGHTELFRKIFAFFVKNAIVIGVYKRIDFDYNPVDYCGLTISESII